MTALTVAEMREALGPDAVGLTDDEVLALGMRAQVFAEAIVGMRRQQVKAQIATPKKKPAAA